MKETSLSDAIGLTPSDGHFSGEVRPGWDVFGIPHGGYMLAMGAHAALLASSAPDIFSISAHFLAKAEHGPVTWRAREVSGSRRFRSFSVEAVQNDTVVIAGLALVGDRTGIDGGTWQQRVAPVVSTFEPEFPVPDIARRLGLRYAAATSGFVHGRKGGDAIVIAVADPPAPGPTDQLLAIVACDAAAPAVWNALGMSGWVPTIELTAQVRARPVPGPLTVVASTRSVSGGFLEEDAEVFDAAGNLVLLSRQLARWRGAD